MTPREQATTKIYIPAVAEYLRHGNRVETVTALRCIGKVDLAADYDKIMGDLDFWRRDLDAFNAPYEIPNLPEYPHLDKFIKADKERLAISEAIRALADELERI